ELLPSVRYELTALAPEYQVRSQFRSARVAGAGYVRWTERVDDARQVGVGSSIAPRRSGRVAPRIDVDIWSHTREGVGIHGAVTLEIVAPNLRGAAVTMTVGAKSTGYVAALPLDNGAYVSAGIVFTPW
ncbi:MAG TPA: hypothetical protein VGD94_09160, partial [Vicinamibacterales bacterium]